MPKQFHSNASAATIRSQAGARAPMTVLMCPLPSVPAAAETARSGNGMQPSEREAAALHRMERGGIDDDLARFAAGMDHHQIVDHQAGAAIKQDEVAAAGGRALRDGRADERELVEQARRGDPAERQSELHETPG